MDKSAWSSDHIVYKISSPELNVFYFGGHTCSGSSYSCSKSTCNYKGSSRLVRDLKQQRPDATWIMEPVAFADSRSQLRTLEEAYIGMHLSDPRCLNQKTSGQALPKHTEEGLQKMREATRRDSTKMHHWDTGASLLVPREEILQRCREGYVFTNKVTWLKNDVRGEYLQVASTTAALLLPHIHTQGWEFGFDRRYQTITAAELWRQSGMKKVTKQIVTVEPV